MPLSPAVSMLFVAWTLALGALAAPMTRAQQASDLVGDPERGRTVYQSVGYCVNCHGWAGDGKAGIRLQAPAGPNLRETELDTAALIETVECGRPGTPMPYHDRSAYRDDHCYGLTAEDLGDDIPPRGRTLRPADAKNVVAYLQVAIIGHGEPNYEECAAYYGDRAERACSYLKER